VPDELNYRIIRVARLHRQLTGQQLAQIGLHPGQEAVLRELWRLDGRTQTELATAHGVQLPTMTKMLASLERNGFLTRCPSPHDKRAVVVELTQQGRDAQNRFEQVWADLENHTSAKLSLGDKHLLASLLDQVADNLVDPVDSPNC
jgi:MarR family transcriptional regulator, organic hydroperoxide resistance regulator